MYSSTLICRRLLGKLKLSELYKIKIMSCHWTTQPYGSFKLNFDAIVLGNIVRDLNGNVMLVMESYFLSSSSFELAKIMGTYEHISKALTSGTTSLFG